MTSKQSFLSSNECLENIRKYCNSLGDGTDTFTININEENISVPIEVAVSISSIITNSLTQDPTLRKMHFDIKFREKDSIEYIKNLIKGNDFSQEELKNDSFFYELCDFCFVIGNYFFIQPYIDNISVNDDFSALSKSEILKQLDNKQKISSSSIIKSHDSSSFTITNEIKYIANNFMDFIIDDEFIEWAKKIDNISLIEQILNNDDLLLDKEDSLLAFILKLFEINNIFATLFQYIYIEYCSEASINALVDAVNASNIIETQSQLSLFKCFTRGCCKFVNTYKPNLNQSKRYKMMFKSIPYNQDDPLKGILNYANDNNNLLLEASSNNNPGHSNYSDVYFLIHMKDETAFCTRNEKDSYIEASLKDNSLFIIKDYLIRGNNYSGDQLQTWVLEGKQNESDSWEVIDSHNNEPIEKYQRKVFSVSKAIPIQKVRLRQTNLNKSNYYYLYINGFEIYGDVLTK